MYGLHLLLQLRGSTNSMVVVMTLKSNGSDSEQLTQQEEHDETWEYKCATDPWIEIKCQF